MWFCRFKSLKSVGPVFIVLKRIKDDVAVFILKHWPISVLGGAAAISKIVYELC